MRGGCDFDADFCKLRLRGNHGFVMTGVAARPGSEIPPLTLETSERVYFMESKATPAGANTYLSSVKLSGDDYKQQVESKYAAELIPSPDGKWVAFKELHKLYVAPLPQTGKMLRLSATETIVPVKTLSVSSGDWRRRSMPSGSPDPVSSGVD